MKLKTAEDHYNASKPNLWANCDAHTELRGFALRFVNSVRNEIADALREALNSAEISLPKLIDDVRELAQAANKPAEVAIETADERRGREEFERFWNGQSVRDWSETCQKMKDRWIAYAKTVSRPKVSPGQRLFEAMNKAYGWGILWADCPIQQKVEAAAKVLGITECDA